MAERTINWAFGPISYLRIGRIWSLEVGPFGLYGIVGGPWATRRVSR